MLRFREHLFFVKNNSKSSNSLQNLLENGHYFHKIEIIILVLHFVKRGLYINTIVKVHIYKETVDDYEFNDKHIVTQNGIIKTVANSERHNMQV
jgi:hypothetical protein